ncbi:hypothetical protein CPC16_006174 [Podila verticillata]|nr:hypothetical protein CPC16_006174 [Podila verticillata]
MTKRNPQYIPLPLPFDFPLALVHEAMTDGPTLTSSSVVQNGLDKMQDARTMDIAFVFTHSPGVRVALWAHQLMLAMSSNRFRNLYAVDRFNNLHRIATNHNESLSSARVYEICTYSLKELSIEAYCALVRYLYTSVLEFKVDMREFVLTHYPVDSPDQYLKRPECSREMNKLMKELLDQPVRQAGWACLFTLADRYQLKDLTALLKERVTALPSI